MNPRLRSLHIHRLNNPFGRDTQPNNNPQLQGESIGCPCSPKPGWYHSSSCALPVMKSLKYQGMIPLAPCCHCCWQQNFWASFAIHGAQKWTVNSLSISLSPIYQVNRCVPCHLMLCPVLSYSHSCPCTPEDDQKHDTPRLAMSKNVWMCRPFSNHELCSWLQKTLEATRNW